MIRPEMSAAEERAVDQHIKSVWDMLRAGRDAAIVHKGGDPKTCLPSWESLDNASRMVFMALTVGPMRQMFMIADCIRAELGSPDGDAR